MTRPDTGTPVSLLRQRGDDDSGEVGMVELFFDLVFVFAVRQLSHTLLEHLDGITVLGVMLLMVAVWWVWIFTSWATNWLDPERLPVRVALLVLMLAGLLLSASIPGAFGDHGAAFAAAFVAMQVGRTLFVLWAVRGEEPAMRRNFQRILVWLSLSGVFWLIGGWAQSPAARMGWWALALGLELLSMALYFWVPGLGRSSLKDWDIDGEHMAERCGLFVIIALGESLLVIGGTFSEKPWSVDHSAALLCAFVGTVAMWWLYFHKGAEVGEDRIKESHDPGRHARAAYTYLHLPIVAGIMVCAVADELVLQRPDRADPIGVAMIVGGPMLYLLGTGAFKWTVGHRPGPPLSHLVGLGLLALVAVPGFLHLLSALGLAALCSGALVVAAVWEHRATR